MEIQFVHCKKLLTSLFEINPAGMLVAVKDIARGKYTRQTCKALRLNCRMITIDLGTSII